MVVRFLEKEAKQKQMSSLPKGGVAITPIAPLPPFARAWEFISSVESQKGVIAIQRCSIENQKGAIDIDFVKQ